MSPNPNLKFPGYDVLEQLGETHASSVYRARKIDGDQKVIIKVIRLKDTTPETIARFRHEYELIRQIDHDGIVRPIDFFSYEGSPALVLEDFGGVSLKSVIEEGVAVDRFLTMAIRISEILGALHQLHVTHRDIKPHNILINTETDTLKITDFGISVVMEQDPDELAPPSVVAGSLAYISPEQTGRINCPVDYRTDIYSLGITFYEMLSGIRPFYSKDPLEMIHSHIAKIPESLSVINPEIPDAISDIVMKLMAKSAQDRYQDCQGLASDLKQCLREWNETGRIDSFELGSKDVSPHFNLPSLLVGRQRYLSELEAAFERAGKGAVEVLRVNGEPGIGKTALVFEMRKSVLAKRGYFISGKFDKYQRVLPYSAIVQTFHSLTRQLLAESNEKLEQWKIKLSAALGQNGRVITDIIPEIELIIGKQPDLPDLGPEETLNRFNMVFNNFVRVFADFKHPLVLFLDDVQWADVASLNLMVSIVTDKLQNSLLVVCAYRNSEVDESHPFMMASDIIQEADIPMHTLQLGPLDIPSITGMISSFIHYNTQQIQPLADAVYEKTKGSPFFINQFLKTIYERKLLRIDESLGWTWDLQKIKDVEATENVVDFIAGKLHELPPASLEIIRIAACIGNKFDLDMLTAVSNRSMDEIVFIIDCLIREGMIIRKNQLYQFYHDRIQEAAYSLIFSEEQEKIHYQVGMHDLERTPTEKRVNRIFFICDQLNQAGLHVNEPEQKNLLAQLNLEAGKKAKDSNAFSAAMSYLKSGCDLLNEDSWETNYALIYSLFIEYLESCSFERDTDESERLFNILMNHAQTKADKGRAYVIMIALYTSTKNPREAIEIGLEALKMFGLNFDINVGKLPVIAEIIKAKYWLKKYGIENIINMPGMVDEDSIVAHDVMVNLGLTAFYLNPNLYALISLKGFNDYNKKGLVSYAGAGCITAANIFQTALGDYDLAYRLGEVALKLNDKLGNSRYQGQIVHTFGYFLAHWQEPLANIVDISRKAYELSLDSGNLVFAGHSINVFLGVRLVLNHRLDDILKELNSHREFMLRLNDSQVTTHFQMLTRLILTLKGTMPIEQALSDSTFNFQDCIEHFRESGNNFGLCYFLHNKALLLKWQEKYEDARIVHEEVDSIIHGAKGILLEVDHNFHYAMTLIHLLRKGTSARRADKHIIRTKMKNLLKWSNQNPDNFKGRYDLVYAEMSRLEGRFNDAVEHYHLAINGARAQGFLSSEAMACEMTADFYFERGYHEEGRAFILQAYKAYTSWGATAKAENLKAAFKDFIEGHQPDEMTDTLRVRGTSSSDSLIHNIDFSTVMKVSQVISREIKLDRLLHKTMHLSVTNSGAERGCLIFESNGQLIVQAIEDVGTKEKIVLQGSPIENCSGVCQAIVNYVYHSGEKVILDNAMEGGPFTDDPYVVKHKCKSILCVPIKNKGQLTCIFYMENNLAVNVFTDERLDILKVIFAQVAISLQNAMLYEAITAEIAVRKQAEEKSKTSENKYRTILEELQDIYCETDLEGNLTFANPSTSIMTGYGLSELTRSTIYTIFDKSNLNNLKSYFRTILETGKAGKPLSCSFLTKNGTLLTLEILTSPIRDKSGEIVGFRNVARDVSERIRLEQDLVESFKHVHAARSATILGLAKLAEYRDEDTGTHLERIREYAKIIALELSRKPEYEGYITDDYVEDIYHSSILHDIGKVGVPDAILLKPGRLTHEEFEIIKTHTTLGGDALKDVENQIEGQTFLTLGREIAYFHHEKWDGSGYPQGLKGEEIPLSARIVALADVYDALTSKRVYKEAFSHEKAKKIIVQGRGSHFAPDVVDAFLEYEKEFKRIREDLFEDE